MPPTVTVDPKAAVEEWREERMAKPFGERRVSANLSPGHVNQEIMSALAAKYKPEDIAAWFDELRNATHKGAPDARTRLAALNLFLSYYLGRPVERSESVSVTLNADSTHDIEARLANSPALREQLRRSLAAADAAAGVVEAS